MSDDSWKDLYKIQYERIAKHEDERLRFSGLVVIITSAVLAYLSKIDVVNVPILLLMRGFLVAINLTAIQFIRKSRYWVGFHQKRAKALLENNSEKLFIQLYSVEKKDSEGDLFRRPNLQINLHNAILVITILHILITAFYV